MSDYKKQEKNNEHISIFTLKYCDHSLTIDIAKPDKTLFSFKKGHIQTSKKNQRQIKGKRKSIWLDH